MTLHLVEPPDFENAYIPPHNVEAEQAFLGAILCNNDALTLCNPKLKPEFFYEPVHQRIFEAITEFTFEGRIANPITLKTRFDVDPALKDAGGGRYIERLAMNAVTIIHIPDYCQTIRELWVRRCVHDEALKLLRDIKENHTDCVDKLLTDYSQRVMLITQDGNDGGFQNLKSLGEEIIEDLKRDRTQARSTGFTNLDLAMDGGLYPGMSYAFVARKKVGKTSFAASMSCNIAMQQLAEGNGGRHLFICGEMSGKEIAQRVYARLTKTHASAFRNEYGRSDNFMNKLANQVIHIDKNPIFKTTPGLTFTRLQEIIATAVNRFKIEGFFLDYWQLVGGKQRGQSTSEHQDEVAQWIATISRELGIWSVTTGQLNQDDNTRGSEGIRLSHDQVYKINRPEINSPNAWLEMLETRYTPWMSVGSPIAPGIVQNDHGPHFEQFIMEDPNQPSIL